jgi:putative ABC transport system ATP-binding protein
MKDKEPKRQIVASKLGVTYFPGKNNEVKSLSEIDLDIKEGEFIIFFGPSGCGKSTLLYTIAGLENFSGKLSVDGHDLQSMSRRELEIYHRETVGMVFQAYHLIPTLTVMQNVILPLTAAKVRFSERKKRALELLERFGVASQANKLPNELSGGQQQRVAICRAVINNPRIILADEPLGNLDSKSANEVINLFKDINNKSGKTVVLVTHDPTYLDIAHRVFFIKDGKIVSVKVNREVRDIANKPLAVGRHTQEIEFLSKHYSKLSPGSASYISRAYQAKNIACLATSGFSAEDFESLAVKIEQSLEAGDNFSSVFAFLDDGVDNGGLGLDRRSAVKIINRFKKLSLEMKSSANDLKALPKAIFDELEVSLPSGKILESIERLFKQRYNGELSSKELLYFLDKPLFGGGAGLDRRLAVKISKRLESWIKK